MPRPVNWICAIAAAWALLGAVGTGNAENGYLFRKIADQNTAIPGGVGNFRIFGGAQISNGTIAFYGEDFGGHGGIYLYQDGSLHAAVDSHTQYPGTDSNLSYLSGTISLDNGELAFVGGGGAGANFNLGLLVKEKDGPIRVIADRTTPLPGGSGNFVDFYGVTLRDGQATFAAQGVREVTGNGWMPGFGVYNGDISSIVADFRTNLPGSSQTFYDLRSVPAVDGDAIVFGGSSALNDFDGIYRSINGSIETLVDRSTPVPGGSGTFAGVGRPGVPIAYREGRLALQGYLGNGATGVYSFENTQGRVVADRGTEIPKGGAAQFTGFGELIGLGDEIVVFQGFRPNASPDTSGLYAEVDGHLTKVIAHPDSLNGKVVTNTMLQSTNAVQGRSIVFGANFNDGSRAVYRADPFKVPGAQPITETRLPAPNGAKNLVLVTHGWLGPSADAVGTMQWVNTMRDSISARVPGGQEDWQVVGYDWTDDAGVLETAVPNATSRGDIEGPVIAAEHYEHVHLVAHSAGSAFVDTAARWIKLLSPETTVHVTFLDAFAPSEYFAASYGSAADWSEQYFTRDFPTGSSTERRLLNAHNVDVTSIDPGSPNHSWPHEFYQQSIDDSAPTPERGDYGFGLSRELQGSSWNPSDRFVKGAIVPLPPSGVAQASDAVSNVRVDAPVDFAAASHAVSDTGVVQIAETALSLQTGSPVWYVVGLDASDPTNFLVFDVAFTSDPDARGLLAIYFDDELLGTIDEQYAPPGSHEYTYGLGDLTGGFHTLAFRLDPYADVPSKVSITDLQLGFASTVPEPPSAVSMWLALGVLLWHVRRRNTLSGKSRHAVVAAGMGNEQFAH